MSAERSRLIDVLDLPIPLASFGKMAKKYPKGAKLSQVGFRFWVRSAGEQCFGCITCEAEDRADFNRLTGEMTFGGMIVCPDCGCKRCPKATQHDNACTGSNDPGQAGSIYA